MKFWQNKPPVRSWSARFLLSSLFLGSVSETALAQQDRIVPAKLTHRLPLEYPATCFPEDEDTSVDFVTVEFAVGTDGVPVDARVLGTTDECFNEKALTAVLSWRYEPRRQDGRKVVQNGVQTTIQFRFEERAPAKTLVNTNNATPLKRVPPKYPRGCMRNAGYIEHVFLEFDIDPKGETGDIRVLSSTNKCLNGVSVSNAGRWTYEPKTVGGEPTSQLGVQTVISYRLFGGTKDRIRRKLVRRFNATSKVIDRDNDYDRALEELEAIEGEYGATMNNRERGTYYRLRGTVKLKKQDYAGALDDFNEAQKFGEITETVNKVVVELETYLGIRDP